MKLRFLTGLAAGYLLGTRAGRERYDQIMRSLSGVTDMDVVAQARAEINKLTGKGAPERDVVLPDLESQPSAGGVNHPPA